MNRKFILDQFNKKNIRHRVFRDSAKIVCPFHNDHNPSLNVLLVNKTTSKGTLHPGVFHCWSCGAHGGWNKLAEKLGLKILTKEDKLNTDPFAFLADTFKVKDDIEKPVELPKSIKPWPVEDEYRGLPGIFLNKIGAYKWWDEKSTDYRLLLAAYQHDELRGYVGARLNNNIEPKYRNSWGEWTHDTWLGFDYEQNKYLKKIWESYGNKVVVVVEGPYDWLRCIYYKIPTIAMLGNNLTKEKFASLNSLGVELIVTFTDGDKKGYEFARKINVAMKRTTKIKMFKLPILKKKNEQLDPGNCPVEYINELKEYLSKWKLT